jgi:DNA-binding PucR family transcriptional regulator
MQRVARAVLAGLDRLPPVQRSLLLETFGVWLDSGGSADLAAETLFCHPNTVRHRLRRLEEHTGRSPGQPREIAELSLPFELDRRITPAPPSAG